MKIAVFGDVVGRAARHKVCDVVHKLKANAIVDFVIVNGENSAGGFGITKKILDSFLDAGVDVVTTGNHIWDQKETLIYIAKESRLLRPLNYPRHLNGKGYCLVEMADNRKILVVNLMGQLFMPLVDDPFNKVDEMLDMFELKTNVDAIIIDFHAEATSEKMAMGHFLGGRVSAVLGTHTHIPTADDLVIAPGTGYISDIGMCGDYHSVLGLDKEEAIGRFVNKLNSRRLEVSKEGVNICAVVLDINDESGLCEKIEPLRVGRQLRAHYPSFLEKCGLW